ncbi:MAG: deoxyribose-phosphate aldolase [Desulfuromonas sp.]|nr:MAG: deoxyribose-phosphate aldolase [Desulfuromonas sp.]
MLMSNPIPLIDHTLLSPQTTEGDVATLCEQAVEYGFASVCVPPLYVPLAAAALYGSEVAVGTVVGFPCGYATLRHKVLEARELAAAGANELDMVISIGQAVDGKIEAVAEEISQVVLAADQARVKVILECCYLSSELMTQLTHQVARCGAAYVKTSTGFGPHGARLDDVATLATAAAGRIGVKAAGGIRDLATCELMMAAGATRIGTSSGVDIAGEWARRGERIG